MTAGGPVLSAKGQTVHDWPSPGGAGVVCRAGSADPSSRLPVRSVTGHPCGCGVSGIAISAESVSGGTQDHLAAPDRAGASTAGRTSEKKSSGTQQMNVQ